MERLELTQIERWIGKKGDIMPTNPPQGSTYDEEDSGLRYTYIGNQWVKTSNLYVIKANIKQLELLGVPNHALSDLETWLSVQEDCIKEKLDAIDQTSDVPKIIKAVSNGLVFYRGFEIPNPYDITIQEGLSRGRDDYMMNLGLHRGFNEGYVTKAVSVST